MELGRAGRGGQERVCFDAGDAGMDDEREGKGGGKKTNDRKPGAF